MFTFVTENSDSRLFARENFGGHPFLEVGEDLLDQDLIVTVSHQVINVERL